MNIFKTGPRFIRGYIETMRYTSLKKQFKKLREAGDIEGTVVASLYTDDFMILSVIPESIITNQGGREDETETAGRQAADIGRRHGLHASV